MDELVRRYQDLQSEVSNHVQALKKLESQLQENVTVQKEFEKLDPSSNVFKLIGPTLVKQDQEEAKTNVAKRLEFIRNEIVRVEGLLEKSRSDLTMVRADLAQKQTQMATPQQ
ncbi:prefoldin subunit 6 [Schizosaccharomyces japonicus yFS275]|uniref:Prefoldin subunit 6 n=1 Tax=Schizosaccharomyces japonicus (strain yFS275 / FY16936) TaxID=402676 RepID=B6JY86_SCHJY|nr:prefoldin subunit 6 [Schizosaccharomyces japonicus yFS275]EEB06504.1 prefoldin subunit 6 [Schizosaccharomyces japonicus yFS275]